jgi:polyisoprenoid-binding protein YceI
MKKLLTPTLACIVFLSACSTTVVDDAERELPADPAGAMIDDHKDGDMHLDEDSGADAEPFSFEKNADISQSFIAFKGSKGLLNFHEGRFNDFDARIVFDVDNVPASSLEANVRIKSMETDAFKLTEHLLTDDFFSADTYKTAHFTATFFEHIEDDTYHVIGDMTMKGVTKEIEFDADITDKYLTAEFTILRNDFGVGEEGLVDNEVAMELKLVWQ